MNKKILRYKLCMGIIAMEGRGFEYPADMVAGSNDRIYVPNRSRDVGIRGVRVSILNLDSEYFGSFGFYGENDGELISPRCIAESIDERLYVVDDRTNKISVFDYDGNFTCRFGVPGKDGGELNGPSGICFDRENNFYIADTFNHRIQKVDSQGKFILEFGSGGDGLSQLNLPWGITVAPDGNVFVADWGNDLVKIYSPKGEFLSFYGTCGPEGYPMKKPSSVAIDINGNTYTAEWGNECVQVADSSGNHLQTLRGEATPSQWAQEFLAANHEESDARNKSDLAPDLNIHNWEDPHTQSAHIEQYFWSPVSVKFDRQWRLYVTESNRHRIQVYEMNY